MVFRVYSMKGTGILSYRRYEMIKVYGKTGCSRCKELKGILEGKKKEFEYIEDMSELRRVAIEANIMMAPIVEYNGVYYTMEGFLKEIGV